MTFQTLEYIVNVVIHANITAIHWYKTAAAFIHTNYVKLWLQTDSQNDSRHNARGSDKTERIAFEQSCFSFANKLLPWCFPHLGFCESNRDAGLKYAMPNWIQAQDAHCTKHTKRAIKRTQSLMCEIKLEYFFSSLHKICTQKNNWVCTKYQADVVVACLLHFLI